MPNRSAASPRHRARNAGIGALAVTSLLAPTAAVAAPAAASPVSEAGTENAPESADDAGTVDIPQAQDCLAHERDLEVQIDDAKLEVNNSREERDRNGEKVAAARQDLRVKSHETAEAKQQKEVTEKKLQDEINRETTDAQAEGQAAAKELERVTADAERALAEKEAADKALADAQAELEKAQALLVTAEETTPASVKQELQRAEEAVASAQREVDEAQIDVENAQKAADSAATAVTKAEDNKKIADASLKDAEDGLQRAEENVKRAQSAKNAADESVEQLTNSVDSEIQNAESELAEAIAERDRADATLKNEQVALEASSKAVTEQQQNVDKARAALDQAKTDADQAVKAVETAKTSLAKLQDERVTAQKKLDDLKAQSDKVAAEKKALESGAKNPVQELKDAQQKVSDAQKRVDGAQKRVDAARAALDKANSPRTRSAAGFLEWLEKTDPSAGPSAKRALQVLTDDAKSIHTGQVYSKATNIGAKDDATSLENMKKSVSHLKMANAKRRIGRTDGKPLPPLRVSLHMMSVGQVVANYNQKISPMEHSYGLGAASENIATGFSDPFLGWYDIEKENYLRSGLPAVVSRDDPAQVEKLKNLFYLPNGHGVGHYMNIVGLSSSGGETATQTMGYGIAGDADGENSWHVIDFGTGSVFQVESGEYVEEKVYTVDEYEALLKRYESSIKPSNLEDALKREQSALNSRKSELSAAQKHESDVRNGTTDRAKQIAELEKRSSDLLAQSEKESKNIASLDKRIQSEAAALKDLQDRAAETSAAVETPQRNYEAASSELSTRQLNRDSKKADVAAAEKARAAAQKKVDDTDRKIVELKNGTALANARAHASLVAQQLEQANEDASSARKKVESSRAGVKSAEEELSQARSQKGLADDEVAGKKLALEEAKANQRRADQDLVAAREAAKEVVNGREFVAAATEDLESAKTRAEKTADDYEKSVAAVDPARAKRDASAEALAAAEALTFDGVVADGVDEATYPELAAARADYLAALEKWDAAVSAERRAQDAVTSAQAGFDVAQRRYDSALGLLDRIEEQMRTSASNCDSTSASVENRDMTGEGGTRGGYRVDTHEGETRPDALPRTGFGAAGLAGLAALSVISGAGLAARSGSGRRARRD